MGVNDSMGTKRDTSIFLRVEKYNKIAPEWANPARIDKVTIFESKIIVPLIKAMEINNIVNISVEKKVSMIGSFNSLLIMYLSMMLTIDNNIIEINVNIIQFIFTCYFLYLIKISFLDSVSKSSTPETITAHYASEHGIHEQQSCWGC